MGSLDPQLALLGNAEGAKPGVFSVGTRVKTVKKKGDARTALVKCGAAVPSLTGGRVSEEE